MTTTVHDDTFTISSTWVLAGDATFTVHNATGDHYTYNVKRVEKDGRPAVHFLRMLTGPDNTSDYTYVGIVKGNLDVVLTRASKFTEETQPVRVIRWALSRVQSGRSLPDGYGIHHEGCCGRCGRRLTVPASVYAGFGPECVKKVGAN